MPGNLAQREDVDFPPGFDGDMLAPPAGNILAPPADAAQDSLSTLEDLVRANAARIVELWEMMRANVRTITTLSNTVTTTSLQLASMSAALTEATETAARAYRLALNAQPTITGQGVKLGELAVNVSKLTSDIDDLRTSIKTPQDLPTLIESALDPLKKSVNETVATATKTAEATI